MPFIPVRISARTLPTPELLIELRAPASPPDAAPLHHQRLALASAPLLQQFPPPDFGALARQLQAAAPLSAGAVSEVALSQALRALAAALRAGGGAVPAQPLPATPPPAAALQLPNPAPPAATLLAGIGDLQRAGPAQLQAAKARMDVVFEANRTRPSEAGFQYDKRAEFSPAEASAWDDE